MVDFDANEIRDLTAHLLALVALPGDPDVELKIDESMPLGGVRIASADPLVIEIDGGALEDPKRLRQFFPEGATRVIGRLLFQGRDLRDPDFGTPAPRDELDLPDRVAWDTYASGRVARLGYDAQQQRWRYAFRTRHGFSDGVDRAFDRLWSGEGLSWADVTTISADAIAAATPAPAA
jgi:hypothetical protein